MVDIAQDSGGNKAGRDAAHGQNHRLYLAVRLADHEDEDDFVGSRGSRQVLQISSQREGIQVAVYSLPISSVCLDSL